MARRKNKKSKRRLAIFGTLSVLIIFYFIFNLCCYSYKIMVLKKSKNDLEQQLVVLKKNEENLSSDIQKLRDPEYIARFARENYMYSKDGEYILKIEDENVVSEKENVSFDYIYLIVGSGLVFLLICVYIFRKKNK